MRARDVWLLAIFGCGRVGFRTRPGAASPDAAPPDAVAGTPCTTDSDCAPCQRCAGTCAPEPIASVVLGHRSTCFLGAGGSRWCVGEYSGLGFTNGTGPLFPTRIAGEDGWTLLAPGWGRNVGVRGGQLDQWGETLPVAIGPDPGYAQYAVQLGADCERTAAGELACNGAPVAGTWTDVAVGDQMFCGIQSGGTLWCWGMDLSNALGQGIEADGTVHAAPVQVGSATDWQQVATGHGLSCAIKTDGTLWCWGAAVATGTSGADTMGVPTQISNATWQGLVVHWQHACARDTSGTWSCWGYDDYGLQVLPGQQMVGVPTALGMTVGTFEMGGHHYCATMSGVWYCWGWNNAGQLGIGTTTTHQTPTAPLCTPGS